VSIGEVHSANYHEENCHEASGNDTKSDFAIKRCLVQNHVAV